MDIIEQINFWHESDEHQKIIDTVEALPEEEQTPEIICLLARAYNNLGVMGDNNELKDDLSERNYSNLEKAIELLRTVENELGDTRNWNYRMGYAYYFLNQEGPALRYFERALELMPEDEDTVEFINYCRNQLACPLTEESFRERTAKAWDLFLDGEAELREMIDDKEHYDGEELMGRVTEMLKPAFYDSCFEMGFNGEKYELILSPNGDKAKLFQLVYFQKHAPAELSEHWNILVGRQICDDRIELQMFGQAVSAEDVVVWVEKQEERAALFFYSEKLLPVVNDEGHAEWFMSILLDNTIGEIAAMAVVSYIEVLTAPREEASIPMTDLPAYLKKEFEILKDGAPSVEELCEQYTCYEMKPNEDEDACLRSDVYVGVTCCVPILNEYLNGKSYIMDAFHCDGAVPGFLYYPLCAFDNDGNRSEAVLNFRDSLENAILESAGEDAVTFIGGASGVYYGYLDFIAWDLRAVLDAAAKFFEQAPVEWAVFHTFRFNVGGVTLKNNSEEE